MKKGNLNLEYQEQENTILFKCQDSGTEYHHDTLDFEFVRSEIDKKNSSDTTGDQTLTYDYCRSIGFCEYGIKNFCDRLGIDIESSMTKLELASICKENEEALFILNIDYAEEIYNLIGEVKFCTDTLDKFKGDSRFILRAEVARCGHALEELKSDTDWYVRYEVAKQGYALEQLKDDSEWYVRVEVAKQGYALEQLKDDSSSFVRVEVAKQGYALEQLKDDLDYVVRIAVARKGYAFEQLKNDEYRSVREVALYNK